MATDTITTRYAVVDLATMRVRGEADTFDQALEKLDDIDFWHDDKEDGPRPQLGVIDLATTEMIEEAHGELVRSWLDAFTGIWRRRIA